MVKLTVVLLKFDLPSHCAGTHFVRFTPIGKIAMVSPDDDRYRGSSEEM